MIRQIAPNPRHQLGHLVSRQPANHHDLAQALGRAQPVETHPVPNDLVPGVQRPGVDGRQDQLLGDGLEARREHGLLQLARRVKVAAHAAAGLEAVREALREGRAVQDGGGRVVGGEELEGGFLELGPWRRE